MSSCGDTSVTQALCLCLPLSTISTALRLEQKLPSDSTQGSENKPNAHGRTSRRRAKSVSPSSLRGPAYGHKSDFIPSKVLHFSVSCLSREKPAKGKGTSSCFCRAPRLGVSILSTPLSLPSQQRVMEAEAW